VEWFLKGFIRDRRVEHPVPGPDFVAQIDFLKGMALFIFKMQFYERRNV